MRIRLFILVLGLAVLTLAACKAYDGAPGPQGRAASDPNALVLQKCETRSFERYYLNRDQTGFEPVIRIVSDGDSWEIVFRCPEYDIALNLVDPKVR